MAEVTIFRGEPGGFGDAQRDPSRPDGYDSTLHGIIAGGGFSPYFAGTKVPWPVATQAAEYRSGTDWPDANGNPAIFVVGGEVANARCLRIGADGTVTLDRTFTGKTIVPERTNLASALHSDGSTVPLFFVCFGTTGSIEYRTNAVSPAAAWATSTATPVQAFGLLSENGHLWAVLTNGYQVRKWPAGTNPTSGTAGAAIDVGTSAWRILGAAVLARSYVVFVKPDGIYVYDIDTNRFENIAPWLKNNIHLSTGKGTREWGGDVYVPLGWGGMARVTQSLEVLDASPVSRRKRPDVETPGRYRVSAMVGDSSYLYAAHEPYWQLLDDVIDIKVLTTSTDASPGYNDRTDAVTDNDAFTSFNLSDLGAGGVNSFIYIGCSVRFLLPVLGITATAVSGTPALSYWNGSAWTGVSASDFTGQMTRTGGIIPTARISSDWAQTAVGNVGNTFTRFWQRINLTVATAGTLVWEMHVLPDVAEVSGTNTTDDGFDRAGARTHIFRGYPEGDEMHWDDIASLDDDESFLLFFSSLQAQAAGRHLIAIAPLGYERLPIGITGEPRMERFPNCVNGQASILRFGADDRISENTPAPTAIKQITCLHVYGRDATEGDRVQAWVKWDGKAPVPVGFNFGLPCRLYIDPPSERGQGYQYAVWVGIEDAVRNERPPLITRVVAEVIAVEGDPVEAGV